MEPHQPKKRPLKHCPPSKLSKVCSVRYQLPADESKLDSDGSRSNSNDSGEGNSGNGDEGDGAGRNDSGRRFSVPFPRLFRSLFSSSANGNSSSTTSSDAPAPGSASRTDEN
ncbi:hypothetical protein F0562_002615 [Nyssa sinensis]|uniref:Uncharacterized protein n=1 Tax=Nyssa sinensis TaxID=561372 RepID=A0A5J5CBA0_9ASTE|nr:hypothetical protein F0562_002615 [Nyssa sinensis]